MNTRFAPLQSIVPILAVQPSGAIQQFVGTGTFVGTPPKLVTAQHVIRDWSGPFAIAVLPDTKTLYPAAIMAAEERVDLAVLDVPSYQPPNAQSIAEDAEISTNMPVVCLEYGTTRQGGGMINLAPATRLGNVTRIVNLTDQYGLAGDNILELSFPALRGASGAPVLSNHTFNLWGIVIANVSYHLLPAQLESVPDESGTVTEETRFMLPQALAVHVRHLRPLLG